MDAGEHPGFGDLLRQHRNAAGLTQEDLAGRAGLNPDTISLLERGERRRPHRYTTHSLAEALGLSQQERTRFETAARMPTVRVDASGVRPTNLPAQVAPFIGREREVEEVRQELLHPDVRLLTLLQSLDAVLDPAGTLEYEVNLAATRTQVSQHAFAKAWQEGKTMTLEQAITEAMNYNS